MHKKQDCYIYPAVIEKMLIITAYSYPIYPAASLLAITFTKQYYTQKKR